MMQRHEDVFVMDEPPGEIGFVFGFINTEIAQLLEDDGRVVRDKKIESRKALRP